MNKYPWLAALWTRTGNDHGKFFCGGTLVANRFVISAAHCMWDYKGKLPNGDIPGNIVSYKLKEEDLSVLLGEHNNKKKGETILTEKIVNVEKITIHPNFPFEEFEIGKKPDINAMIYDIVLLKLTEDIVLTKYTPACLPKKSEGVRFDNELVTAAGWGSIEPDGPPFVYPDEPKEVNLTIIEAKACGTSLLQPMRICSGNIDSINTGWKATCEVSEY